MKLHNNKFTKTPQDCLYAAPWKVTTLPFSPTDKQAQEKPTPWKASDTTCTTIKEVSYPELSKISSATSNLAKIKT